jgi:type I restriction enzyme S subunit
MSWKNVKLGDILTESKEISEFPNPDRRITVRLKVLGVEKRGLENEVEGATKQYIRKAGQFIYGKQNFHKGAFGIVPQELNNFESSSDLPAFDVDKSCLPEFIFYFFKQGNFYLELSKIASGVATQRINTAQLFQLELLLPDIKTQKKLIANIESLETNGGAISTEFKHQLTLVKKLRQQLLQDAVQGKLVEQNKKDEPASELFEKIKAEKAKLRKGNIIEPFPENSIPYNIPSNWVWCKFGEIIQMTRGKFSIRPRNDPSYFGGEYPFIQIGSLDEKGAVINEAKQTLNEKGIKVSKKFPKNTIAIAIVGGTIGNLGVLGREMYFTDSIIGILPNQFYNQEYILNYLRYKQPEIKSEAYQMAGQPNIKIPTLENLLFPMPPIAEQNRIVQKLDELMQYCNVLEANIKQSVAQNEKLLQQVLREALRREPVEA